MTPQALTRDELDAGEALFRRHWTFARSVPHFDVLPDSDRPEIAFAGRSNVGKSSLINMLVNQYGLARTSNTPGRTQELNFFEVDGAMLFIVDLPGYGYAQAPKSRVDQWTGLVEDYLRGRPTLARVFLLVDARHGLKDVDLTIMALMDEAAVSYQGVLTKIDKIKPTELVRMQRAVTDEFLKHAAAYPAILTTSSQTGSGIAELRAEVARLVSVRKGRTVTGR